ncbi:MAG: ATP-binding protein, partial [Deltaproteobacteria bacterium]
LPICQRIVKGHGGHLEVRSREGAGAEFVIRLPTTTAGAVPAASERGSLAEVVPLRRRHS